MNVDWKKADDMYRKMFLGDPIEVRVCLDEIGRYDNGERSDEEILDLLERDADDGSGLSRGQLDCIEESLR